MGFPNDHQNSVFLFPSLNSLSETVNFLKITQLSYQLKKLTQNHNRVPKDHSENSIILFLNLNPLTETSQEPKRNNFSKEERPKITAGLPLKIQSFFRYRIHRYKPIKTQK